ncbi:MAG: alpha-amylase [Candidatus Nanogingivalaceae bacterium]|nr:alpha-amylase [Candidatus Nanogingivalaceae bacterium]
MKTWYNVASLYQIYPRSFRDTNGDGIGDLNGITERLDYLAWLGVDAIWISPFFVSPLTDFGYDISDYRKIDPTFGKLDDFRALLEKAHTLDIKVMIDLVPCHTSDQHPWFQEARSSRDNPKRDYYVWRDGRDGNEPNNWRSLSGGSSWELDERTGQYYLHSFLKTQPDLNWDNPTVRDEIKNVVRFWFDMGVDGMRVDAIWGISKDPEFGDDSPNSDFHGDPEAYGAFIHDHCKMGPHFQEYLRELASVCDEYDDKQMVFEFYPDEKLGDIYQQYHKVLTAHPKASAFFMEYRQDEWHAEHTGQKIEKYLQVAGSAKPFFCVGNHDQLRIASRLGAERARALHFLNLLTPSVSVMYYGDEISMTNGELTDNDIQDNFSPANSTIDSRDLERTPMQWDDTQFAGFSSVQPWLPVHTNAIRTNVLTQAMHPDSLLHLHRRLLHLRRSMPVLQRGTLEVINTGNGFILGIKRKLGSERAYIFINFADQDQTIHLPEPMTIQAATSSLPVAHTDNQTVVIARYGGLLMKPISR